MELYKESIKTIKIALSDIVKNELSAAPKNIKYLGGGSFGKVFKVETADGKEMCLKVYRYKGMSISEAAQLKLLSSHTDVKMPEVLYVSDEAISILAMSYIEGRNALNPLFLLRSKNQKSRICQRGYQRNASMARSEFTQVRRF